MNLLKNNCVKYGVLASALISGCGTGPWIVRKELYKTYKEPVYEHALIKPRLTGIYLEDELNEPHRSFREAILLLPDGHAAKFWVPKETISTKENTMVFPIPDTLRQDLSWWQIKDDSIIIEHYAENRKEMSTWKYIQQGIVRSDTTLQLQLNNTYPPRHYTHIWPSKFPVVINKARYLQKKWYVNALNEERKK